MATLTVEIKGINELLAKAERYAEDVPQRLGAALTRGALLVEREAKALAPVDTGRLRASITHGVTVTPVGAEATVGTGVEYAVFQEFGTSRQPAQPFLFPAFEANRVEIVRSIAEALEVPK